MKYSKPIRIVTYLILAASLSVSVAAQSMNAQSMARISADSSEVRWQPSIEYARLVLTVSTPEGDVFRKEFDAGVAPSFKLIDDNGVKLADGHYRYELRFIPAISADVKKALAASRVKGNSAEVIRELKRSGQLSTDPVVQSGSFLVQKDQVHVEGSQEPTNKRVNSQEGEFESQGRTTGDGVFTRLGRKPKDDITAQDQVIPDDLIVQGSACVGLDCVNNESFGFDTIRMKENNTRVKFDDTSTSAGFPANDWQLTANDSASGGQSKFSIEDITGARVPFTVEAGATTNSIYVDSTGRVGFRTSTPVLDLHVNTSNTPGHRLEQNNSGGFTAQTWDVAGNEANFFIRDVTGGSLLPFRIRPGAPTSSLDIAASGNVGIGTASPDDKLDVEGQLRVSGSAGGFLAAPRDGSGTNHIWYNPTGDDIRLFNTTTGDVVTVLNNGNVGIGTTAPAGKLDVNGSIFQRGAVLHADYVFEPTYKLESIEDHAVFMWKNKHLPAMKPRTVDAQGREVIEVGAQTRGILEELEKAHIYISELNDKLKNKEDQLTKLQRQNSEMAERLARIEAMLSAQKTENK